MKLMIKPVEREEFDEVYSFQIEYLEQESLEQFMGRVEAFPDLYLVAWDLDPPQHMYDQSSDEALHLCYRKKELIGICYATPSHKYPDVMVIQGIAVSLDESKSYARKGYGSRLLEEIEKASLKRGLHKLDVGSADDEKVEKFYVKNGFQPYELVAKNSYEELERVPISSYEQGKIVQKKLREKHQAQEVIFIFGKNMI